jgi:hypothetical protein
MIVNCCISHFNANWLLVTILQSTAQKVDARNIHGSVFESVPQVQNKDVLNVSNVSLAVFTLLYKHHFSTSILSVQYSSIP